MPCLPISSGWSVALAVDIGSIWVIATTMTGEAALSASSALWAKHTQLRIALNFSTHAGTLARRAVSVFFKWIRK